MRHICLPNASHSPVIQSIGSFKLVSISSITFYDLNMCDLSYKTGGHVYNSCIGTAMLHASETWALTKTNLMHNDRAMIRKICSTEPENVATVGSRELMAKFEFEDLDLILRP